MVSGRAAIQRDRGELISHAWIPLESRPSSLSQLTPEPDQHPPLKNIGFHKNQRSTEM